MHLVPSVVAGHAIAENSIALGFGPTLLFAAIAALPERLFGLTVMSTF